MRRNLLDTSVLVRHWLDRFDPNRANSEDDARRWAVELMTLHSAKGILSVVWIEFVCGTRTRGEMSLAEAYLSEFAVVDGWEVRAEDLREADRIARRVPPDGKRRQLGDCLIRAMANRLRYDVISFDKGFPRR